MLIIGSIPEEEWDVAVVGTGLAGCCAAAAAKEAGAKVVVIDKAPETNRGGNTRFSGGGVRAAKPPEYTADQLYDDIMTVTRGRCDPELARTQADKSVETVRWLESLGVGWGPISDAEIAGRVFYWGRSLPFEGHRGLGNGLLNMLHQALQRKGVPVLYETKAEKLLTDRSRRVIGIRTLGKNGFADYKSKGVVLACGGFQANVEMRVRYIGKFADALALRGSRFNTGDGLRMALDIGAQPTGQWGDFHSAVIDARSPKVEAGETNVNRFPFSVMVNKFGKRFIDEGEDYFDVTYVKSGKACIDQPDGQAFCIYDAPVHNQKLVFGKKGDLLPTEAPTIRDLALKVGIDPDGLEETIKAYNNAVQPGKFDPDILDGKKAVGIYPTKSNWALKIETPPFYVLPVTGGVTFTFGGLKINTQAQVIDTEDRPIPGLYAAGEIIGGIFYYNYPGGSSLMRGAVYGKIAGTNAAKGRV